MSIRKAKRNFAKWYRYVGRYRGRNIAFWTVGYDKAWSRYIRLQGPRAFVDAPRPE